MVGARGGGTKTTRTTRTTGNTNLKWTIQVVPALLALLVVLVGLVVLVVLVVLGGVTSPFYTGCNKKPYFYMDLVIFTFIVKRTKVWYNVDP